jgi:4-amino-4-deoxy-L-arabinose transferase-like glycosyltransferase
MMTLVAEAPPVTIVAPVAYSRRPRWIRPALWVLLGATALLYLWGLGALGYGNEVYAASVQTGTQSWTALLFGSLDPANAVAVENTPAAVWVMGLSARLLGFGTWAMLVPQALMGVGSVALIYGAVRRASGPIAGLLAGALLALTPLAALMFRYNEPDALLVLLLVAAGYCTIRALDCSSGRWLALAGTATGFALLTSVTQALVVAPAIGLVVLVAAPGSVRTRVRNLLIGLTTTAASAGWFVALLAIWPADSRPHSDGFTDISLARSTALPGISWLPAALIGLIAMLWFTRFVARTSRIRAGLLFWGSWMLLSGLAFGYTLVMAPALAALTAISIRELWRGRQFASSRATLALMLVATVGCDVVVPGGPPVWLRWPLLLGAVGVASALLLSRDQVGRGTSMLCAAGLLLGLAGAAAHTIDVVTHDQRGAGPGDNRALDALLVGSDNRWAAATVGLRSTADLELSTGKSVMAISDSGGPGNSPTLARFQHYVAEGQIGYFVRGDGDEPGAHGQINSWVAANFVPQRVGDVTVYDLAR